MSDDEKLLGMLSGSVPQLRLIAIDQISTIQDKSPAIIEALRQAVHDEDPQVAEKARQALLAEAGILPAHPAGEETTTSLGQGDAAVDAPHTEENRCPNCDSLNVLGALFCNYCGKALPGAPPELVSANQTSIFTPTTGLPPAKKSHKRLWIGLGSIFIIILVGCGSIYAFLFSQGRATGHVLDDMMDSLVANNVDQAYDSFSPYFQAQYPKSKLSETFLGDNYFLVEGYQGLTVTHIQVNVYNRQEINLGLVADTSGTLDFGSTDGTFTARLHKINGTWKILSYNLHRNINNPGNP